MLTRILLLMPTVLLFASLPLLAQDPECGSGSFVSPNFGMHSPGTCALGTQVSPGFGFDTSACNTARSISPDFEFDTSACDSAQALSPGFLFNTSGCSVYSGISPAFVIGVPDCIGSNLMSAPFKMDPTVGLCGHSADVSPRFVMGTPNLITRSIGEAKLLGSDNAVTIQGSVVTAVSGGWFYMQDRSVGIRVDSAIAVVERNEIVDVDGFVSTDGTLERRVTSPRVRHTGRREADPLAMNLYDVGGGDFGTPPLGQKGVAGGIGTNNIGLLVQTWGSVVGFDQVTPPAKPTWLTIRDGSGADVKCIVPGNVVVNTSWTYAFVTGISSCEKVGSELHRLIRVRDQADITGSP